MPHERALDFFQLDAVAADLDLPVDAAEELDAAVRQIAAEIAGAVEASGSERILYELLRRQLGLPQVAAGDAFAADADLARQPLGQQPHPRVEQIDLRRRNRSPDRDRGAVLGP